LVSVSNWTLEWNCGALTDLLDQQHPGNGVPLTSVDPDGQQYRAVVILAPGPVG
jgi:hypothetical protein